MRSRQFSTADRLIGHFDRALKGSIGGSRAARENPANRAASSATTIQSHDGNLSAAEKKHAAGLMRVNHAGEIAAQALYHGQSLTAKHAATKDALDHAAAEEIDHLAWCEDRLSELGSGPSHLAPFWYAGSFAIGAFAGLTGDKTSLGFVAATEDQVVEHLQTHMTLLPDADQRSRDIIQQMQVDEAEHGEKAMQAGGQALPEPVQELMRSTAKIMTTLAYRF